MLVLVLFDCSVIGGLPHLANNSFS